MEVDQLIEKEVHDTLPPSVLYELTEYGQTLKPVIHVLAKWGSNHREKIIAKPTF